MQNLDAGRSDGEIVLPGLYEELLEQIGIAHRQMRRRTFWIGRVPKADLDAIEPDAFSQFDRRRFGFELQVPVGRAYFQAGVSGRQPVRQRSQRQRSGTGSEEVAAVREHDLNELENGSRQAGFPFDPRMT